MGAVYFILSMFAMAAGSVLVLPFVILALIYQAWVASILWVWFMVPLGLPVLTIAQLMGVMLIKAIIFFKVNAGQKQVDDSMKRLFVALIGPLFILMVGYILRFWIM